MWCFYLWASIEQYNQNVPHILNCLFLFSGSYVEKYSTTSLNNTFLYLIKIHTQALSGRQFSM